MESPSDHAHERFSPLLFAITVGLTLVILFTALRCIAPEVWRLELAAPAWTYAAVVLLISLFNCFFEFFFHRYVLHRPLVPGFARLYRQHTLHHALTRVGRIPTAGGSTEMFVENKFPMTEPAQGEGSFFPWYSLAGFALFYAPFFVLLHWLVPTWPWFLGGIGAFTVSLILYEGLHAINHWPMTKWKPLIEHPTQSGLWRAIYSFHIRHHAVIDCNESVSGFFGLPVADWTFRTCVIPGTLYANGETWTAENFTRPRPRAMIRVLDQFADRLIARRRSDAARD